MTECTDREAYEIGVFQKQYINWILLVYVIAFFIPYATWVAGIAVAYFVYKIAEAQKSPVAWLWALSQVIPYVGLVCLLILSQNATRILKGKGIKVGLLGAKSGELDKLVPPVASARSSTSPQKSTYTIYGAHRDTGNDMNIKVQATGEQEAVNEANRCGILVSKVVAEDRSKISWPQSTAWIKVAGGVVAAGLILVVLTQSVFLSEPAIEAKSNTGVALRPPTLSRSNTAVMTTMHKLQSAQIRVRQHHKDMETREQLDAFYAEYMNELNRINMVLPHNLWVEIVEARPTPRSPRPGRVPPGKAWAENKSIAGSCGRLIVVKTNQSAKRASDADEDFAQSGPSCQGVCV